MNGAAVESDEFVEVDPTGRYGRYNEVLGKGASKTVYKAFDEYDGIEVAWNQVKLHNFMQSPEDLERLYSEIHLLKNLHHKNIMKFYTSWVDTTNRNINFVTEMFTSGTLRQYRQKHKRVNIRAVKHWCRQILEGLLYLHSHDPPIIHRDLKCDNIFVNGNQGVVKIGDLGLAAILRKSDAAHCVGTPEFMAPEVYEEMYNELVDIYSFGMCILEMVTFDYPYSECNHPAQIYKKVISGRKPDALYKVKDPEVRRFVDKCLVTVSHRLSASELLMDPFLQIDDYYDDLSSVEDPREFYATDRLLRQPLLNDGHFINGYSNGFDLASEIENEWEYHPGEIEHNDIELFPHHEDDHSPNLNISIKGKKRENGSIFLRLRIKDTQGHARNIFFEFDMNIDTALSVATEMVAELDITDQDVTNIADMIDGEIASLIPEWKVGLGIVETPQGGGFCLNCASNGTSNGSLVDYLTLNGDNEKNQQIVPCSQNGCMHGRFEEITSQEEAPTHSFSNRAPAISSHSYDRLPTDIWNHNGNSEPSSQGYHVAQCDHEQFGQVTSSKDDCVVDKNVIDMTIQNENSIRNSMLHSPDNSHSLNFPSSVYAFQDDYEKEIRQELRWLKARYHLELRELKNKQIQGKSEYLVTSPNSDHSEQGMAESPVPCTSVLSPMQIEKCSLPFKPFTSGKCFSACSPAHVQNSYLSADIFRDLHSESTAESFYPEHISTAKSFYTGTLFPHSIHRTTSLPVDAVEY